MGKEYSLIMDDSAMRLDKWLSEQISELSRSKIQELFKAGLIQCDGQIIDKGNIVLEAGRKIKFTYQTKEYMPPEPQNIPLDIVYEDQNILVINKPIGIAVHPGAGNPDGTLVNALLFYTHGHLSDLNGPDRPGIVHRLDKDTAGLLIVCKNNEIHLALAKMFKQHQIKRCYRALVWGQPQNDGGLIDAPIGRHPVKRIEMAVTADGKRALTKFKVLTRYPNEQNQPLASELELSLVTGRTHQIRVHLAHINLPIIGDPLYHKGRDNLGLPAQALYSSEIAYIDPLSRERMHFTVEAPVYYEKAKAVLARFQTADGGIGLDQ